MRARRHRYQGEERLGTTASRTLGSTLRPHEQTAIDLQQTVGNAAVATMVGAARAENGRAEVARAEQDVPPEAAADDAEPDWDAPIEDEADVRSEGGDRREGERREDGAGGATATATVPTTFPGFASMKGNGTVREAAWDAWKETVRAATATSRREQGFWIQWDATSVANATGDFQVVGKVTAPAVGPTVGATVNLPAKPADSGNWYTVGSFHTHTPTKYRAVGRPVGPSSADVSADTTDGVAGLVYDYDAARSGTIPAKWPLWSESHIYHSGPRARP